MIVDSLDNLKNYVGLNPLFPKIVEFLKEHNLKDIENGKTIIDGKDLFLNVMDTAGKTKEDAVMETHKNMLDIQIPLDNDEVYGYTPTELLPEFPYNAEKDATKYPGVMAEGFVRCHPGMMAIFWPQDGHQPCIGEGNIHKAVFKVKC